MILSLLRWYQRYRIDINSPSWNTMFIKTYFGLLYVNIDDVVSLRQCQKTVPIETMHMCNLQSILCADIDDSISIKCQHLKNHNHWEVFFHKILSYMYLDIFLITLVLISRISRISYRYWFAYIKNRQV